MAVPGREPDPNSLNRNKPTVEWVEVEDKPYAGKRPTLPKTRPMVLKDGTPIDIPLSPLTNGWWDVLSKLPHCVLWKEGDWSFALSTVIIADLAHNGMSGAFSELRIREAEMGLTAEARRKLRIRYIPPAGRKPRAPRATKAKTATVTQLDERRQRALANG
jgi:hypothetical protein